MARKLFPVLLIGALVAALLTTVLPRVGAQDNGFPVPPGRLTVGDDDGLYLLPADGSGEKDYLIEDDDPECWIRDGAWNADGTQIMYTLICGGNGPTDWRPPEEVRAQRNRTAAVYVYDLTDDESTELIPNDGIHQDYAGNWSPDGDQVVIYSDRNDLTVYDDDALFNIWLVDVESGELTRVTTLDSNASRVSFDPTGRYLLYNRRAVIDQNLTFEVRAFDLNSRNDIRIAEGFTPNWSPDGEWIIYATEGDSADIFVMPVACLANGGGCDPENDAINVTQTPDITEREPVFSPDQTQIVYLRDISAPLEPISWDLYRHDLRTGLLQNITETPDVSERHRAWEPVSTRQVPVTDVLPVMGRVQTSGGTANLREEPTTNGAIAGQVSNGQIVFLQGTNDAGDWYHITLPGDGAQAWLFGTLVQVVSGDETTLESVE